MRDVLQRAAVWAAADAPFAVATVSGVRGSAPRELGASMIVSAQGEIFGTVSGGCVEAAVAEECATALASGLTSRYAYGIGDDDVVAVGLTCGGVIEVCVWPVLPGTDAARAVCVAAAREAAGLPSALVLELPRGPAGEPGSRCGVFAAFDGDGRDRASGPLADAVALAGGDRARVLHDDAGDCPVAEADAARAMLVLPFGSPPRLIVVGAVEFAVALSRLGQAMGYRVAVVDPRPVFAAPARFPGAEVAVRWPDDYLATTELDARTAVCVLGHDPRIDVPALVAALRGPAGYVGAMGSRRTHADRLRRLAEAGVPASACARLRSPIGLDLGGRTPEETALSILAEIVALGHGASGQPLSAREGDVHASAGTVAPVPQAAPAAVCAPMPARAR